MKTRFAIALTMTVGLTAMASAIVLADTWPEPRPLVFASSYGKVVRVTLATGAIEVVP